MKIELEKRFQELIKDKEFDEYQLMQIKYGILYELDTTMYAKEELDDEQMREIRQGLEEGLGLGVHIYADCRFSSKQMKEIRLGLQSDLNVNKYANPNLSPYQMSQIRKSMENALCNLHKNY